MSDEEEEEEDEDDDSAESTVELESREEDGGGYDPSILMDGVDLTGDTGRTRSNFIASGLFLMMVLFAIDFFTMLGLSDMMDSDWSSMLFFLIFLVFCFAALGWAAGMGVGNSTRLRSKGWVCYSILAVLVTYIVLLVFRVLFMWPFFIEQNLAVLFVIRITIEVSNAVLLLLVIGEFLVVLKGSPVCPSHSKQEIVLVADEEGKWGADDVYGLLREAGVKDNYFTQENEQYICKVGILGTCRELFWPQPFDQKDKFPHTEHLREVASRVRIIYPPRLKIAFAMVVTTLIVFGLFTGILSGYVAGNRLAQERWSASIKEDVDSRAAERDQACAMVPVAMSNVEQEAAQPNNTNGTVQAAFSLAASQVTCTQADLAYNVTIASYNAWFDRYVTWGTCICISMYTTVLLALWFAFISFQAYRKGVLELLMSMPHYRFHPKRYNYLHDKKFIGMYFSCFVLGFLLFNLLLVLLLRFLCWPTLWQTLWNHIHLVFTALVYYAFTLLLIPVIHGCVVAKDHRLVRPRAQSALIFVWEIFYSIQMAISVCLHVCCALFMTVVMLWRPDQFLMRNGWEYLDMMFFVYPSMQYEQIMSGTRKYARDHLEEEVQKNDDFSYSRIPS